MSTQCTVECPKVWEVTLFAADLDATGDSRCIELSCSDMVEIVYQKELLYNVATPARMDPMDGLYRRIDASEKATGVAEGKVTEETVRVTGRGNKHRVSRTEGSNAIASCPNWT